MFNKESHQYLFSSNGDKSYGKGMDITKRTQIRKDREGFPEKVTFRLRAEGRVGVWKVKFSRDRRTACVKVLSQEGTFKDLNEIRTGQVQREQEGKAGEKQDKEASHCQCISLSS